jgi:hypothetical protein
MMWVMSKLNNLLFPANQCLYRCSDKHFEAVGRASLCPTRHRIGMRWLRVKIIF